MEVNIIALMATSIVFNDLLENQHGNGLEHVGIKRRSACAHGQESARVQAELRIGKSRWNAWAFWVIRVAREGNVKEAVIRSEI